MRKNRRAADVGGRGAGVQGLGLLPDGLRQERTSQGRRRPAVEQERFVRRRFGERVEERLEERGQERIERRGKERKQIRRVEVVGRQAGRQARAEKLEGRRIVDGTDQLRAELVRAAQSLGAPADVEPIIERPRDPSFGDWATNLAMVLAKPLGLKPRDLAAAIVERLDHMRAGIRSAEIAGPGFINFRVASDVFAEGLRALINAGDAYGRSNAGQQCPVNIEFVSANPTGPLHVGHGRQAALGDAISSLLAATGWRVTREFYYNDTGAQIMNLAGSVQARVRELKGLPGAEIPEGGYHGEYIRDIAERYASDHP